jgi:long-chain acyl-CoA synthetase
MHPSILAANEPDKIACWFEPSGVGLSYGELEQRSNRAARYFRAIGLHPGDSVAFCIGNHPLFFELAWGAERAGLFFTPISTSLSAAEIEYIVRDCDAKLAVVSTQLTVDLAVLRVNLAPDIQLLTACGEEDDEQSWHAAVAPISAEPIADPSPGVDMLYSSGTTGRPKGIRRPRPEGTWPHYPSPIVDLLTRCFDLAANSIYLSPAPLYHAAPLRYCMAMHRIGATCVIMEKFDAAMALELIERHCVTHSQWVPTMFVRLAKLEAPVRQGHDLRSHICAIHASAPCPVDLKRTMLEWWGPIIHEYYSGSEGIGMCLIGPEEWLAHPGSVGRCINAAIHIMDETGEEVAPGTIGSVFFETANQLSYYKDDVKTAAAYNHRGWSTMGDIGFVDEDGYLYLTDRKAFTIISGGVNIYPQEIENVLIGHPHVADVAVFGVPHEEFGEAVQAVVQPVDWAMAGPALADELLAHCRANLSRIKCPRSIDFDAALPREANGKLYKKLLQQRYREQAQAAATAPG